MIEIESAYQNTKALHMATRQNAKYIKEQPLIDQSTELNSNLNWAAHYLNKAENILEDKLLEALSEEEQIQQLEIKAKYGDFSNIPQL